MIIKPVKIKLNKKIEIFVLKLTLPFKNKKISKPIIAFIPLDLSPVTRMHVTKINRIKKSDTFNFRLDL